MEWNDYLLGNLENHEARLNVEGLIAALLLSIITTDVFTVSPQQI